MRLWHYKLLPYLPDAQFKGQLREVIAIMHDWRDKGTTNHILINRVMDYPKADLSTYFAWYCYLYKERYGKNVNSKYIDEFMKKNKFIEVKDLKNYIGKKGIYVLILDEYKQAYLGLTDRGIKERIKDHWNAKKEPERLIFGQAFNSILSIDSFGALDTTRIFVKLDGPLYEIEYKLVDEFDKRYLLNRTIGGIGSVYTYSDDKYSALAAVMGNSKRRDYTPFINEDEFYKQCSKYDIDMYEYRKKNGGIFD